MTASADNWLPLGKLDDMAVGDKREVTLPNEKIILLLKTESGLHATCADCPHQETPLVEGMLNGDVLTCPLHLWQWDIKTGEKIGIAELPLDIFELREDNGEWFIRA